jgi:Zn-dependent protease with chaperone function
MSTVGAHWLERATWPLRSPRLGIWVWQSVTASILLAVLLVGATLALPTLPATDDLASLLHACFTAVRSQYLTPGGATASLLGLVVTLVVAARLTQVLAVRYWVAGRCRRRHRAALLLVGCRHEPTRAVVLPHPAPTAYCLPGRPGMVVFSRGALAALSPAEVAAVAAHERAHLRGRHHLVLLAADVVRAAFPFVPAFTAAHGQLGQLVEMRADDAAVRHYPRRVLATALVVLAGGSVPTAAMAAGATIALARAQRLTTTTHPLRLPQAMLALAVTPILVALPLLIAVGPAIVAALLNYCPLGFPPYS